MKKVLKNPCVITFAALLIFAIVIIPVFFASGITRRPERPPFEVTLANALELGTEENYAQFTKHKELTVSVTENEIFFFEAQARDFTTFYDQNYVFRVDESLADNAIVSLYSCNYLTDDKGYTAEWKLPDTITIGYGSEYIPNPFAENCFYALFTVNKYEALVNRTFDAYMWDEDSHYGFDPEYAALVRIPKDCVVYSVSDKGEKSQVFPVLPPVIPDNIG